MLFERTYEEILGEAIGELTAGTRITKVSSGAKARTLLEILSRKLNESYKTFDLNHARAFVGAASGRYLDFIGDLLGVPRLGSAAATASTQTKSVRFYVSSGTFGDINSGSDISIEDGTVLSTERDSSGTLYRVTTATTLLAASSSTYVPVQALVPGESSNLGSGLLIFHSFTGYSDFKNATLLVTNDQGIFTGRNIESDANYRFRIVNSVTAGEAANRTAVLLSALSVPGVAEVNLVPFAQGLGTFDILIKSQTPTVSIGLVNAVQGAVEEVCALGSRPRARKPVETGLSFSIQIRYSSALSTGDRSIVEGKVRQALTSYINGLDIGEEFVVNEAVQRVLEVDGRIRDIGSSNKPFQEISIWREGKLADNRVKQTLLGNYNPAADERVIIEPSISTPIQITTLN